MRKYFLPALFVILLALNAAAFALVAFELDGNTVKSRVNVRANDRQ
jgi:hypothetical protein